MTASTREATHRRTWTLPNQITSARIALSVLLFVALHFEWYLVGIVVFVLAALTDWVDGYLARKTGQITQLGRIMDPFADKIVVCGTFVFLAAVSNSGIKPWMAVLIVGREMLVTVLRSFLEQHGKDFSAQMSGKLKMVFQCAAAVASLVLAWYLASEDAPPGWMPATVTVLVWVAILSTVFSGVVYILAAIRLFRELALDDG